MNPPNIIFIVLDTLRADRVQILNEKSKLTPFLQKILKKALFFENCYANSPWTLPSHISMFTGLYPTQVALISEEVDKLSDKTPILTEILKNLGYKTYCFSENAFISQQFGLVRGFDKTYNVWDWNPWMREKYPLSFLMKLLKKFDSIIKKQKKFLKVWKYVYDFSQKSLKCMVQKLFFEKVLPKLKNNTIDDLNNFFNQFTEKMDDSPKYLFFNFLTTHDPYIPLESVCKSFNITSKDFKIIKDIIVYPLKNRLDINIKSKKLSSDKTRTLIKLYDACVKSADIVVEALFIKLNEYGFLKNSYIIITSDHGEHLGGKIDHFFWEHNTYQSVYNSLIKVPLLIYSPLLEKKIVEARVQLKDLFHTILHIANINDIELKQLDIKCSILYQAEHQSTPKQIYGEYLNPKNVMVELINSHRKEIPENLIQKIYNNMFFLITDNYKYIKYKNMKIDEMYDITADPFELNNLITPESEIFSKIKRDFNQMVKEITDPKKIVEIITSREKEHLKKAIGLLKFKL